MAIVMMQGKRNHFFWLVRNSSNNDEESDNGQNNNNRANKAVLERLGRAWTVVQFKEKKIMMQSKLFNLKCIHDQTENVENDDEEDKDENNEKTLESRT